MFNRKPFIVYTMATMLWLAPIVSHAESVKFVQWWNAYFPPKSQTANYGYRSETPNSSQYLDVNGDGVYNDALVWNRFSMTEPLNPLPPGVGKDRTWQRYRINRPSAQFYGGMVARFTNVSHITEEDRKGNQVPFFDRFQQTTVQPVEGTRPCSYSTNYPHNKGRVWNGDYGEEWADMTVMVVNNGGECCPFSDKFQQTENAEVNFTAVFLWKKEDFINGGAAVDKIIFDDTSKLSVDVTRFRENIEEGRFVVQEGDQFWISEAAAVQNAEEHLSAGVNGMTVEDFKRGAIVELNPLKSRWAPYTVLLYNQEQVDSLVEELEEMEFNPKTASSLESQRHQQKSDELLTEINRMEFDPTTANFIEHAFEDVQAVGVYFATYPFAQKITQLVFDNFQAHAAGTIPKVKSAVIPLQPIEQISSNTEVTGGISVNCGPFERVATQCVPDHIKIQGEIIVDPADVGQLADIIIVAGHKPSPEAAAEEEVFYMLNETGAIPWDGNISNLVAFQDDIRLESEQSIPIYQGQIALPGFLRVFFGYRLPEEGKLVYSHQTLDMIIVEENTDPRFNELPYSESIKDLCRQADN